MESWTFDRDFMPASIFKCKTKYGMRLEKNFLRNIRHHEILNDDHVCPDSITMGWHLKVDQFGIEIKMEKAEDKDGFKLGYHVDYPIKDLKDGFSMLKPAKIAFDREGTMKEKNLLEETFGDILPVEIRTGNFSICNLTGGMTLLISMETFLIAMYDCPEKLLELMGYMRDNAIKVARFHEREGLLTLNNGNQATCGTCFNFTTLLPKREVKPGEVKLSDLWVGMNSQETVGVSPDMFHELIFPFYRELAQMFGLVYWGCCEPVDPIWETSISKLPGIKAVSISRWCKQEFMAEALDGKQIVYSRKPNPNIIGVGDSLDEDAWAAEIRSTLDLITKKKIPLEFVVRDVYSLNENLGKASKAVEIARREIDKCYGIIKT